MMQTPLDASRADEGLERIRFAQSFMPVTAAVAEELRRSRAVAGLRIAVSDVLEPKTAAFTLALRDAGAEVVVACAGRNTDDAVAAALVSQGIPTYADSRADAAEDRSNVLRLLDHRPDVVVDDGSWTIRIAHTERPALVTGLLGATEQTTSGVRPLRTMERQGALRIPVIAVNDARTKSLFDNAHGTGQAVVFAILDLLGEPLAGRQVVVAGFGPVGEGIARHARALGAVVTVAEVDPVAALRAVFSGYGVQTLEEAASRADILISATGVANTVDVHHLLVLPAGAAVAVGGGVRQEIALRAAAEAGAVEVARVGKVSSLRLPNGRVIRVLDDGNCINVSAAEGNPIPIMDLSFAVQLAAVGHLAREGSALTPGVHVLPREIDDAVASRAVDAFGGRVDRTSTAQRRFLDSWTP